MIMEDLFYDIGQVLGITIVNSIWQGLAVYGVLQLLFIGLPSLRSTRKYHIAMLALLVIALAFSATFCVTAKRYHWHTEISKGLVPVTAEASLTNGRPAAGSSTFHSLVLPAGQRSLDDYQHNAYDALKSYLPYISIGYLIGLVINLLFFMMAWQKIRLIKRSLMPAKYLQQQVAVFSRRMGFDKQVQVHFSLLVDVPCVIGYLKPILLLPVTLTTQLTAAEVEAILLHELAHIKNNDYLLNILQQVITVILFFNPFAQLIGRSISRERENCCDDSVVMLTGSPLTYVHALIKLEETRRSDLKLALAATQKRYHLFSRIERMTRQQKPASPVRHLVLALVIITGSLLVGLSFRGKAEGEFTLTGRIDGPPDAKVRFAYTNYDGKMITEFSALKNGAFTFKGRINGARMVFLTAYKGAYLLKADDDPNYSRFFIGPGHTTVSATYGHLQQLKVEGSPAQQEYLAYRALFKKLDDRSKDLEDRYLSINNQIITAVRAHKDDYFLDSLYRQIDPVRSQLSKYRASYQKVGLDYLTAHPRSFISAFELLVGQDGAPADSVKKFYQLLSPAIQNSSYGKEILKNIVKRDDHSAGKAAVGFNTTDANGKPVSLTMFKGKYVLLNFWTSTEPILDNAPHLIGLYKKYHGVGLEIIGVADDDHDPEAWKRAIKRNGTGLWHQVLRGLRYDKGKADESHSIDDKFAVSALPSRILIGPDGVIAGRYTGTEELAALDQKLAQVFNK